MYVYMYTVYVNQREKKTYTYLLQLVKTPGATAILQFGPRISLGL